MTQGSQETVIGRITSVFGIKGWVKVYSYTDPRESILNYRHWVLSQDGKRFSAELAEGRRQGQAIVVRLKGVDDRNQAMAYCGSDVLVSTEALPELPEGEYYWYQLEGLTVETREGECFGCVHHLMETGANDVLVVRPTSGSIDQRERLIPWLPDQVVREVDLPGKRLVVDWDPEF